jgi:DNA-directed RNA polymerase specialized sigma24 family protein
VCSRRQDRLVESLTRSEIGGPGEHGPWFGFAEISIKPSLEQLEKLRLALATLPDLDRYLVYQRYVKYASAEGLAAETGLTRQAIGLSV